MTTHIFRYHLNTGKETSFFTLIIFPAHNFFPPPVITGCLTEPSRHHHYRAGARLSVQWWFTHQKWAWWNGCAQSCTGFGSCTTDSKRWALKECYYNGSLCSVVLYLWFRGSNDLCLSGWTSLQSTSNVPPTVNTIFIIFSHPKSHSQRTWQNVVGHPFCVKKLCSCFGENV